MSANVCSVGTGRIERQRSENPIEDAVDVTQLAFERERFGQLLKGKMLPDLRIGLDGRPKIPFRLPGFHREVAAVTESLESKALNGRAQFASKTAAHHFEA